MAETVRVIWKFEIPTVGRIAHRVPLGATPLDVQVQQGFPRVWMLANPNVSAMETVEFEVVQTGASFEDSEVRCYVGTFQLEDGVYVGHVFMRREIDLGELYAAALDAPLSDTERRG